MRPKLRTFDHFPERSTCPICGTSDDDVTVLVPVAGTQDGNICEARPMHLACAVIGQWDDGLGIGIAAPIRATRQEQ